MNPIVILAGGYLLKEFLEWKIEESEKRKREDKILRHYIRVLKEEKKKLLMKREIIEKNKSLLREKNRIIKSNRKRLERVGNDLVEADEKKDRAIVVIKNDLNRSEENVEKKIEKYSNAISKIDKRIEKIELTIICVRYALRR